MNRYYLTDVDRDASTIYCHHDQMGEQFIPDHEHRKDQLLYTEGGIVHVRTAKATYYLPALHLMWIPAGVRHSIHPSSPQVVMRNLYFPADDTPFFNKEGIYPANRLLLETLLFTARWTGDLLPSAPGFQIALSIRFLLLETYPQDLNLSVPWTSDQKLKQVLEFVDQNLAESHSFSFLAARFGFSERSLYRLFQKELNMSFTEYHTMRRMLKAVELLTGGNLHINEIARESGYSSVPTFSNTFFRILGKRPSDYRKDIIP